MRDRSHDTWDQLLGLLGEMQRVFQHFLSLLHEEEHLLRTMDRQGVADIVEQKEQALEGMCRYEQQVMTVMQQLAGPEHQGQLGSWLKKVRQPEAFKATTMFHELFGQTRKIQAQAKKNEALIRRAQHVVREAVNLIYTGLGAGPVYQGSGALQFSAVPSSVNLQG